MKHAGNQGLIRKPLTKGNHLEVFHILFRHTNIHTLGFVLCIQSSLNELFTHSILGFHKFIFNDSIQDHFERNLSCFHKKFFLEFQRISIDRIITLMSPFVNTNSAPPDAPVQPRASRVGWKTMIAETQK